MGSIHMHPQLITGHITSDTSNDIFSLEAPQRHKDCSNRNLIKSSREKCKVFHLSWNDSYTLGGNWLRWKSGWKSGGYSGFQAEWGDPALTPQGSCVLHYIRNSMAGRSRKVLFPCAWQWWGCIGHTIQSGTWTLHRNCIGMGGNWRVSSRSLTLTRSGQRPGAHDWQTCAEACWGRWKEG